jgi:hypothetical protein
LELLFSPEFHPAFLQHSMAAGPRKKYFQPAQSSWEESQSLAAQLSKQWACWWDEFRKLWAESQPPTAGGRSQLPKPESQLSALTARLQARPPPVCVAERLELLPSPVPAASLASWLSDASQAVRPLPFAA